MDQTVMLHEYLRGNIGYCDGFKLTLYRTMLNVLTNVPLPSLTDMAADEL